MEITREIAARVLETVDAGLASGLGRPTPGEMCVLAAICYALGRPHGDNPSCVAQSLRALSVRLNDAPWSSPEARAHGLRRIALAQLGSKGHLDDRDFARRVAEMTIRKMVPIALRSAAEIQTDSKHRLCDAANRCENEGTALAAYAAYATAHAADATIAACAADAAYAAATSADAANAASNASDAAIYVALSANAADATVAAANAAAYAADAAAYANADVRRDETLADFAESVVGILIEMDAPGVQWLDLAPAA